ncbi:MAG: prepilin-type N-terminal cleavage/methylation domain-containing protein [Planctomycetota bacterium]|nr:MAG: prepilin-type N-terminal cleavage/methylation domain-containing protein [Planctomycetota bacterium]
MNKGKFLRRRKAGGFTLLEILVVILLVGLLLGMVGKNVIGVFIRGKKGAAEIQIKEFEGAIQLYQVTNGKIPEALEDLLEPDPASGQPYITSDSVPLDPWGNEYDYQPAGSTYTIISYGADGSPGGEGENADISSEEL